MTRRSLFSLPVLAAAMPGSAAPQNAAKQYRISLAQWSLHKAIQSRLMTNLDFPRVAREQFGIAGLEFVNALWEAPTADYVRRLKNNMRSTGTTGVLIMVDGEGYMGHSDRDTRMKAAEHHRKWVQIAAELGCHSIRTNMYPGEKQPSTPAEIDAFLNNCAESFNNLCGYCFDFKDGRETTIDMDRMMSIVNESSYGNQWVGIEYEGARLTEFEGIQAAKTFLTKYAA